MVSKQKRYKGGVVSFIKEHTEREIGFQNKNWSIEDIERIIKDTVIATAKEVVKRYRMQKHYTINHGGRFKTVDDIALELIKES